MSQNISQILEALQEPFPSDEVEFKPGATNKEKTKALALAYVDSRPYIQRLNQVSPDWHDEYQITTLGDRVVVLCRLTVNGVTRTGDGECLLSGGDEERVEPNAVTTASAQAFKRACVKFGLGAYLYALPQVWCEYDAQKRRIVNPPALPDWALPAAERKAKAVASAVEREQGLGGYYVPPTVTPLEIGSDDDDTSETAPELSDPGQTVVPFGKMKGKSLAQIWALGKDGQGWIRWCANTDGNGTGFDPKGDPKNVYLQRMARAFLTTQAAYAG
ncbi:MAG: Rad52/Rad22 family DNA repair protein [Chloroflexota bacterium]